MIKLPKNIRDIAIYVLANFAGSFLGYCTLPFFTDHLSPEDFGVWGYVLTANTFLSPVILLDLHSYYLVEYYKQPERKERLLNSLISFSFVWTIGFLLVGLLAGGSIFNAFNISIAFYPFMSVMLLSNLTSTFFLFLLVQSRLDGKSLRYAFYTILQVAFSLGFAILLIYFYKSNVLSRIAGFAIGSVVLGLICMVHLIRKQSFKFIFDKEIIRAGVKFSLPLIPYSIAVVLFDFLDRFFLEKSLSLAEIGYYSLAFQLTSLLSVFFLAILRVFEPNIMKWITDNQKEKFVRFLYLYLVCLFAICMAFSVIGPIFLNLVTNVKFISAGPIAVHLISAFYFKTVFLLLMTLLISFSKTNFQMVLVVLAVAIFGAAGYSVTEVFHLNGMILLKTGLYLAMCLISFIYAFRYVPVKKPMALFLLFGSILLLYCNYYL